MRVFGGGVLAGMKFIFKGWRQSINATDDPQKFCWLCEFLPTCGFLERQPATEPFSLNFTKMEHRKINHFIVSTEFYKMTT